MTEKQAAQLEYPFTADEIEWRLVATNKENTKGLAAPFVDSRAIQKRLDSVIGRENWQNHFTTVLGSAKEPAAYICEIGIFYPDRNEWIYKSDGAGSTDIEPVKGGLSNAYKRAASMWGAGRYIYDLDGIWVQIELRGKNKIILDSEKPRIDRTYNAMVSKYLAGKQPKAQSINEKPAIKLPPAEQLPVQTPVRAANPQKTQPVSGNARQAAAKSQPQPQIQANNAPVSGTEVYKVTDAKITRGGKGSQTFVVLRKSNGESLNGYIKGADIQTGQTLTNLHLIPKNDPLSGKYNIISSYEIAA